MSTYELKEGQGSLFRNDKKGNEKAPDYRGSIKISNRTFTVAGWVKDAKNGSKFLSLKIEAENMPENPKKEENNGDLPF